MPLFSDRPLRVFNSRGAKMIRPAIDKEFQDFFPALTPDQYNLLQAKIVGEGCRDKLVLWKGHNVLVDGYNRLAICEANGIEYKTCEIAFNSRAEVLQWMFENQEGRRNWTASQRAMLAAKVATLRQGEHPHSGKSHHLTISEAAAKVLECC
jgi:hypothetical protein